MKCKPGIIHSNFCALDKVYFHKQMPVKQDTIFIIPLNHVRVTD